MFFEISAGDFVAAAKLLWTLSPFCEHTSTSAYRKLTVELHNLERALDGINQIQCVSEQTAAVTASKAAALTFRSGLEEFATN